MSVILGLVLRHLFRLLLLLSLSLFSGQMIAAQASENTLSQHYTTSEKLAKLIQHEFESIKAPFRAWQNQDSWGQDGYFRHLKRDVFGLLPYRRTSGSEGELSLKISPNYHLLVAFMPPPLLAIALQATPLPSINTLSCDNQPYHLSGWKQANLLYVFKHSRESKLAV